MIPITHPKLLALKEYMELTIDSKQLEGNSAATVVREIFDTTGILVPASFFRIKGFSITYGTFQDYYKNTYLVNPKHDLQVQNSISKLEH